MKENKEYVSQKGVFTPRVMMNSLLGFALLIIVAINIFSFLQLSKFFKANQWVIHTYQVLNTINEVFISLVQIESATRGFIITHQQSNLQKISDHEVKMYQKLTEVKDLIYDNRSQQQKLELLKSMLEQRINLINKIMQLTPEKNTKTHIALVNQGNEQTNKITNLIHDFSSKEQHLLEQRNKGALNDLDHLHIILLITSIVSGSLFILGIIIININLLRQNSFLHEKRKYENLVKGIIEGTQDIVVVLDLNFHFIIFNNSFEHEFKSIFGIRPRVGTSIIESLSHLPEEQKKVTSLWERALGGEEFSLQDQFGSDKYNQSTYECNFNSIFDENGNLIGAASICRNIDHRIKSEKSLKLTNEKLENAYDTLKQHDTEVSLLNEMENALQSCNSIGETLLIINRYCQKLVSFAAGIIYLINPSRNYLEVVGQWNSPNVTEKIFTPNQCWGLRQGKNYIYVNNGVNIPCEHMNDKSSLSSFCIPLLAQNDIIGMLQIVIMESDNISEKEINELYEKNELLIKNLAVQLSLAIANIQLRETLKTRSIRDPLTGLYNRMYLNEFLERDLQRANRDNLSVTFVMMDVDHFKKLNDTYGHDAGDLVLKELGKLLQDNVRTSDISCRYGGEEFLLIFYETNSKNGYERVEKLRILISQMSISIRGIKLNKITASFGLSIFPEDGTSADLLITRADQALYQSKKNGRDKATIYKKTTI